MTPGEAELARLYRRVREEPRSTAFVGLADTLRQAGRYAEGLKVLREGFRAHPDHPAARVVLARIHLEMGNRALAAEVLTDVTQADPDNLAATALLARLHVEDGNLVEARPLVERLRQADHPEANLRELAVALAPAPSDAAPRAEDPFDRPALAARFARAGHYQRAWAVWSRLDRAAPGDPTTRERLAALERSLAGLADAEGEPPLDAPRRALPGLGDVLAALADDVKDRPPPRGRHPVARWGRKVWRGA